MTDIQDAWQKGYLEGWAEQGAFPTSSATVAPLPSTTTENSDHKKWAYDEGKDLGQLDRVRKQAGLS